jgi:hypothetical protein
MILVACEQGSAEWHAARAGVITASRFKDACDTNQPKKGEPDGAPSAKLIAYAAQVAVERVTGQPADEGFMTWQMRRGVELEPAARLAYEAQTGNVVEESGVVLTDDRRFGYSTDGFIGADGAVEIKCIASPEKLIAVWRGHEPVDYLHQIQGGLWLTGRRWIDLVVYAPQLEPVGKELFVKRIKRDEDFIETLEVDLLAFSRVVDGFEAVLRMPAAA